MSSQNLVNMHSTAVSYWNGDMLRARRAARGDEWSSYEKTPHPRRQPLTTWLVALMGGGTSDHVEAEHCH